MAGFDGRGNPPSGVFVVSWNRNRGEARTMVAPSSFAEDLGSNAGSPTGAGLLPVLDSTGNFVETDPSVTLAATWIR